MWYPGKAALRAGTVTGSQWNDIYIGDYSIAFGLDTKASAEKAVAMGFETTVSRFHSFAAGERAAAEGIQAFVWNDGSSYHGIPNTSSNGLSSSTAVVDEPKHF